MRIFQREREREKKSLNRDETEILKIKERKNPEGTYYNTVGETTMINILLKK